MVGSQGPHLAQAGPLAQIVPDVQDGTGLPQQEVAMSQLDLFRPSTKPWNAGRITGPKAPLKPKHVWAIRQQKTTGRVRDLALFNCALVAKLWASDVVRL